MVTIKFLGVLADKIGNKAVEITLENPIELKDACPMPFKEEDVLILIDGKVGHLTSRIENGDFVTIMPMLSGG